MHKWVFIGIIIVILCGGIAGFYYTSPDYKAKQDLKDTYPYDYPRNQTPVDAVYTKDHAYYGFLNGSFVGRLYADTGECTPVTPTSPQGSCLYAGIINGTFKGYGNVYPYGPVYFDGPITSLVYGGIISGMTQSDSAFGTPFNGTLLANTKTAMNVSMVTFRHKLTWKIWIFDHWREILAGFIIIVAFGTYFLFAWLAEEDYEYHSVQEVDFSVRPILKEDNDKIIIGLISAKPIPNGDRPKFYSMLYKCAVPDCLMRIDAKFEKVIRFYGPMLGTDITAMESEGVMDWGFPQQEPKPFRMPRPRKQSKSPNIDE